MPTGVRTVLCGREGTEARDVPDRQLLIQQTSDCIFHPEEIFQTVFDLFVDVCGADRISGGITLLFEADVLIFDFLKISKSILE